MEISFLELKEKEVINVFNGQKLGHIIDFAFDLPSGRLTGLIVPGDKKLFRHSDDIFVPLENVKRIGSDVILVGLQGEVSVASFRAKKQSQKNFYARRYSAQQESGFENSYNIAISRTYPKMTANYGSNMKYNSQNSAKNIDQQNGTNKIINSKQVSKNDNLNLEDTSFVRLRPLLSKKYK